MKSFLLLFFRVWIAPAFGKFFANPVSYPGRGTVIGFSSQLTGSITYTPMPQLEKFDRSGSKTETDDVTCVDSPGNNKFPAPVVVDNGKYTAEGVFDPQNPGITSLMAYQQSMQQISYQIVLTDGTTLTGLCYVTQFEAPKVDRYKRNRFMFEIDIFGGEVMTPQGGSPINE